MYRPRKLEHQISQYLKNPEKRIIFLWGPRQTGKSVILEQLKNEFGGAFFNFDSMSDRNAWIPDLQSLKDTIALRSPAGSRYVFIDEVQNNPEATVAIKLLTDNTDYVVFATGSSELRAKTQKFDSLAGRYKEYILFPLTLDEMAAFKTGNDNWFEHTNHATNVYLSPFLKENMIFGSYPRVILTEAKVEELRVLARDSVIKDIVNIYNLKDADLVENLLRLLAMQIGNLINISELCSSLQVSKATVSNYLSILQKNRIIYFLNPLKTNKRRGYLERKKVYFYDLGIRNVLIDDFRPLDLRSDIGAIFENLVIMGVVRQSIYKRDQNNFYFFREIAGAQKELDLIIETPEGNRHALEIKYKGGSTTKFDDLRISKFDLVTQENVFEYLI